MPNRSSAAKPSTRDHVLDVAERLAQTRGFNGFSYADIAAELKVTKASLHYHFPSKTELGCALLERYGQRFGEALSEIHASGRPALRQLEAYVQLYAKVLRSGRLCLCGMLAAEYLTIAEPMRRALRDFFDANEAWLTRLLESGREAGDLSFDGSAAEAANALTSSLEGAMLLARSYGDPSRFVTAADRLLRGFTPEGNVGGPRRQAASRRR